MPRVLMLNYEFPPLGGGAANATWHLLRELGADRSMEVDLITSSVGLTRDDRPFEGIGVRYLDIGKRGSLHFQSKRDLVTYSLRALIEARRMSRRRPYDLVHAFFGIPCGFLARRLGLPYVVSLRGSDVPFYNPRFARLDRLAFQRLSRQIWGDAAAVVANSRGLRELARETAPDQRIQIITNGVDTERFCPAAEQAPATEPTTLRLVSTGRLIERKGYAHLIDALAGRTGFTLELVGEGNIAGDLARRAAERGVAVEFTGALEQSQVISRLQRADLFVLPSLNEGMSNSALEAAACGLPLVLTDVGGSAELVDGNGFMVPPADPAALAEALQRYRDRSELLGTHGARSQEIAQQMSWASAAQRYRGIYAAVCAARKRRTARAAAAPSDPS